MRNPNNSNILVHGYGIKGKESTQDLDGKRLTSYSVWSDMLRRCYSPEMLLKNPTYADCTVCPDWMLYKNFKEWFNLNHKENTCLDKDILVRGNKVYSPETCVFVPQEINKLLITRKAKRGEYPIGVCLHKCGKFVASGKSIYAGLHNTVEEAFLAFKSAKEINIREVALRHFTNKSISEDIYIALMNWSIKVED